MCVARCAGRSQVEAFKVFGPAGDPFVIDLDQKLGVGAQGTVYRCHRQNDPSQVFAVKAVPIYEDDAEGRAEALERETRALLQGQGHEGIAACVGCFDVSTVVMHQFPTQGRTILTYKMIVMEIVTGGELAGLISAQGCLDEATARGVFARVVSAVKFLHAHQVLHRDLKCENILVCAGGLGPGTQVKLVDFGVAKDVAGSFAQTCVGTAEIMAPELVCADLLLAPGGSPLPAVGPFAFASPLEQSPGFGLRTQRTNGTGALIDGLEPGGQAEQRGVGDGWALAGINGVDVRQMLFAKNPQKPQEPAITELLMGLDGPFSLELTEVPKREFTEAIDCWSLGVVLYTMLSGKKPFSTQQATAAGAYPQLEQASEGARDLVAGLLRLDPASRLTLEQAETHPWLC